MKIQHYILIILFAVLAISCKDHQEQIAGGSLSDSTNYIAPEFKYMQSSFTCDFHNIQARGQIRMQSDSLIWISINKFIELGRMQLTCDSVFLYTKFNNAYYKGTYQDVEKQFAYTLDYLSMQNLIITAVKSDSTQFTLPVRSNVLNIDLKMNLENITYPEEIKFPFRIPTNAHPWIQPTVQ